MQFGTNFASVNEVLKGDLSSGKISSNTFLWYCLLCLTRFESVNEILKCEHSDKTELLSSTFLWCCLLRTLYKVVLTDFESVDELL